MHWTDAEELAMHVLGLDEDSADGADFDALIYEKFEVSMEQFQKVAEALIRFTPTLETALTNTKWQGFVKDGFFIVKQPVE